MKKNVIIFLSILFIAYSCSNTNKTINKKTTITTILPLTGGAAILGKEIKEGMQIALDNDSINKRIKIIFHDSKNSPKESVSIVEKSLINEKPELFISAMSGVTTAIVPIINKNNKLLVATVTGKPNITKLGKNIFRFYYTTDIQGETVVKYAINELKLKRINIIYINDDYGVSGKDFAISDIKKYNGIVGKLIAINKNEVNLKSSLQKITSDKNSGSIIIAYGKTLINIISQLKELNNTSTLFTYTGIADPTVLKTLGSAADSIYLSIGSFNPFEPQNKLQKNVFTKIMNKYHKIPSHYHAFGYDLVHLIYNSLKNTSQNNIDSIKYHLENIDYNGMLGHVYSKNNKDIPLKQRMAIIINQKIEYIK